MTTFYTGRARR